MLFIARQSNSDCGIMLYYKTVQSVVYRQRLYKCVNLAKPVLCIQIKTNLNIHVFLSGIMVLTGLALKFQTNTKTLANVWLLSPIKFSSNLTVSSSIPVSQ